MKAESPYAVAQRVLSKTEDRSADVLSATLFPHVFQEPYLSQIVAQWCRQTVGRHLKRNHAEPLDFVESRAAIKRGLKIAFDQARLPDGRLFADVPRYEYAELKQTFRAWAGLIEWAERYARVNDDTLTAREYMKPADFDARWKSSGLAELAP